MGSRRHIPALDGLRGLAILMVFVFHYGGGSSSPHLWLRAIGAVRVSLWMGVPLFFVLSGFLITGILWNSFGKAHWWRDFYIRRSLRIFPLYYFSLLLIVLAAWGWGNIALCLHRIPQLLFYVQNLPFAVRRSELGSPIPANIYWSLAVEEHFYLLWPFLLRAVRTRRQGQWVCVAIFLLSFGFRVWGTWPGHEISGVVGATPSRVDELAIGSWLGLAAQGPEWEWERVVRWVPSVMAVSAVLLVGFSWWTGSPAPVSRAMIVFGVPAAGLFFGGLLCLALQVGSVVERCAEWAWLRWLGGISYGVYVYHSVVRPLAEWLSLRLAGSSHNLQLLVQMAVGAGLTVGASVVSFRFLEKPFLDLKGRLTQSHYPQPPEHAVVD